MGSLALRLAGTVAALQPLLMAAGPEDARQKTVSEPTQKNYSPFGLYVARTRRTEHGRGGVVTPTQKPGRAVLVPRVRLTKPLKKAAVFAETPREQACLSSKKAACFRLCVCACVLELWTPGRLNFA